MLYFEMTYFRDQVRLNFRYRCILLKNVGKPKQQAPITIIISAVLVYKMYAYQLYTVGVLKHCS